MTTAAATLHDAALPGLARALEREALMELLSERLPECRDGTELLDARVVDVQYAPGAGAQVLWKLRLRDGATGRKGRQLVTVRALRGGEAAVPPGSALVERYRALRARRGMQRELPLATPWLEVPGAALAILAFPLDPGLPTLFDAVDPDAMRGALHRAWRPRRARVRRVRVDTLSYTPGARAALRYEVLAEDKDSGLPELRRLVGKLHASRSPSRLFAGHWAVWRRAAGRVSVAPPVGYVSLARLSLQEFVPGVRLSDLAGRGRFVGLLGETARAIAHVHGQRLPLLARRGPEKEMRGVDRWIGVLSRLCPEEAARLEDLGTRVRRELADRARITATVHADFHLANVLADAHGVTLVDWDQVAHGDAMADVGRVLASLRVSSLRVHGTTEGFADMAEGFLRAYLARTGDDERRARLFEAASLLIAAAGPFRLQRSGWEEGAAAMLDEVERTLTLACRGPRVTPPDASARALTLPERAAWALDRTYAQALLVPVVHETHGPEIEVTECHPQLLESRPDRLHVRWTVKGWRASGERWRGALEGLGFPDHSGRGVRHRLERVVGAASGDPGALRLPRPLGHLEPLNLLVFVPPAGERLVARLGAPGEPAAVRRVADALARLHALEIDLGRERPTGRELAAAERRIARLEAAGHHAAPAARALLERLRPRVEAAGERRRPTPRGLDLEAVVVTREGAGAAVVDDVVLAEPLLAAGALAAQLRARAIARGASPTAAGRFVRAYAAAARESPRAIAAFESLDLVRRACGRALRDPSHPGVHPLLAAAAALLDGTPAGRRRHEACARPS